MPFLLLPIIFLFRYNVCFQVSVASLFSQSNAKPENRTRPSSADMFERRETENTRNSTNTSNQGNRRYAARSLSLSFSNEQFHNAHKNIVNGAISVEELESPTPDTLALLHQVIWHPSMLKYFLRCVKVHELHEIKHKNLNN